MAETKRRPSSTGLREIIASLQSEHGSAGCWPWPKGRYPEGYGRVSVDGSQRCAHRVVYELLVGLIPDGLELDHLCRNPPCVNPAHLEPVSHRENLLRSPFTFQGINARKTECIHGHPFDATNTYVTPAGHRECRACRAEACRRWQQKRRSA